MPRELQHGSVVDGVAETNIHRSGNMLSDGEGFACVGWDLDEPVRSQAMFNLHSHGQHTIFANAKALYPGDDGPHIRRADGPDVASGICHTTSELLHLG